MGSLPDIPMDTFEVLPEYFDHLENFEIGHDFWSVSKIPENFHLPPSTTTGIRGLLQLMDEMERPYKAIRQLFRDDGVCEFLEGEMGKDTVQKLKKLVLPSKEVLPPTSQYSLFVPPKSNRVVKNRKPPKKKSIKKSMADHSIPVRKTNRPKKTKYIYDPTIEPIIDLSTGTTAQDPIVQDPIVQEEEFEVERILEHTGDWNNIQQMWFKVHWLGYTDADDTWEPYGNLDGCSAILKAYKEEQTKSLYLQP